MAEFTWTSDAPDGVYKNHALSNKLLEWAAVEYQVAQIAQPVGGFGKNMGESVTLANYEWPDIPADPSLLEADDIPLDKLTMRAHAITVTEFGRGIQITDLSKTLSKYDPEQAAQKALKDQMRACMDRAAATAAKTAKVCAIPTSATALTFDTDGTPSTSAASNLTLDHAGLIRDYMVNDLHTPFYKGDHYIGLFTTRALRGLKGDDAFQDWHKYLKKGDLLYNSEVGRAESIRFVEVTNEEALSNSIGTGSCTGEGLVVGDEGIALAEAVSPHLRYEPNYNSQFGRFKAVAWYGVLNYGLFWPTADDREARIVRWASA